MITNKYYKQHNGYREYLFGQVLSINGKNIEYWEADCLLSTFDEYLSFTKHGWVEIMTYRGYHVY